MTGPSRRTGRPRTEVLRRARRGDRLLILPDELESGRTLRQERRAWLSAASRTGRRVATSVSDAGLEIQVVALHRSPRPGRNGQPAAVPLSDGGRVIEFIEIHCRLTKGRWIGQPFVLQDWQKALLWRLFELRADGRRRYRWALIGVPKKQGKMLAVDTPIPTPQGWRSMGDLDVGDQIFDERGHPCTVVAVSAVNHDEDCHRVAFTDGTSVIAGASHPWATEYWPKGYKRCVTTTAELVGDIATVRGDHRTLRHRLPARGSLQIPEADLPIDPYALGLWLGDGARGQSAFTTADPELLQAIRNLGYATQFDGTPERPYAYSVRPALARATLPGTAAATPRAAPRPIAATLAIRARIGCGTNHPESTSFGLGQLRSQRGWAPVAGLTKQTGAARQRTV